MMTPSRQRSLFARTLFAVGYGISMSVVLTSIWPPRGVAEIAGVCLSLFSAASFLAVFLTQVPTRRDGHRHSAAES
jgi:hypothetical protein